MTLTNLVLWIIFVAIVALLPIGCILTNPKVHLKPLIEKCFVRTDSPPNLGPWPDIKHERDQSDH
jgi:hypothetical protein